MNDGDFAWMCLIVITVIGTVFMALTDDAEGAGTPMWEPDAYLIDEVASDEQGMDQACRGPDNIVRRAWQDDDYALVVSYTSNNGSTWADSQVIDSSWKGHTTLTIGGILCLANNTTIVHFIADNADDNYNSYVAVRWNWTGSWDIIKVFGSVATGMSAPRMAWNGTKVLLTYANANTIRYKRFDPVDHSMSPIATNLPTQWIGAFTGLNSNYGITVNQSRYFIIAANSWSGSSYRYYIRDLELTHLPIYATIPSAVWTTYGVSIMSTSDDGFSVVAGVRYSGMGYWGVIVFHNHAVWGGFQYEYLNWANTYEYDTASIGTSLAYNDRLTIYWANDTGVGGAVYILKTSAHYQADEPDWEGNMTHQVYDYGTDDDVWFRYQWYDEWYPVIGGYKLNQPLSGWMGGHTWRDEKGATDDYAFALYWNASFYWYVWAPAGPGPGGGSGGGSDPFGEDEPWVLADPDFMGDLWTLFVVTSVFVGIATAYRKYTDRYTGWKGSYQRWSRTRPTLYKGYRKPRRASRSYYREVRYQGWRPRFRRRNWGK